MQHYQATGRLVKYCPLVKFRHFLKHKALPCKRAFEKILPSGKVQAFAKALKYYQVTGRLVKYCLLVKFRHLLKHATLPSNRAFGKILPCGKVQVFAKA
jgi:hypothetical protein